MLQRLKRKTVRLTYYVLLTLVGVMVVGLWFAFYPVRMIAQIRQERDDD